MIALFGFPGFLPCFPRLTRMTRRLAPRGSSSGHSSTSKMRYFVSTFNEVPYQIGLNQINAQFQFSDQHTFRILTIKFQCPLLICKIVRSNYSNVTLLNHHFLTRLKIIDLTKKIVLENAILLQPQILSDSTKWLF